MEQTSRHRLTELPPAMLKQFFISHLNRIYCAKTQLADKLPLLNRSSGFPDLRLAISETITMARHQIDRLKAIYFMLNASYQPESCVGIVGILDEAFQSIGKHDESSTLRDLPLLSYMFHIENIETTSFEVLLVISEHLKEPGIIKLLTDCYNEAQKDKVLFQQITQRYAWARNGKNNKSKPTLQKKASPYQALQEQNSLN
jgi:ferritin-like metal-binding protein YciE